MRKEQKEQYERLANLKREAWDIHDIDLVEFYNQIEYDLKRLRACARAAAYLYQNGGGDEAWNAIFESLSDAGLLTEDDIV